MKLQPECIPCLLEARAREVTRLVGDRERALEVMLEIMEVVADGIRSGLLGPLIGARTFRIVRSLDPNRDPYREYRRESNRVALELAERIRPAVESIEDPLERFRRLLAMAALGNALDPGAVRFRFSYEDLSSRLLSARLDIDDAERALRLIKGGAKVVYLCDNAGEIVFDKLLMRELKRLSASVFAVVRSAPFQNDALLEDAKAVGLDEVADRILESGADAPGLVLEQAPPELRRLLDEADLIISKGLGNFEMLSEYAEQGLIRRPILYVLIAKCEPVARCFGARKGDLIAKLWLPP